MWARREASERPKRKEVSSAIPGTSRFMEWSFPTKHSRSFLPMHIWVVGMSMTLRSSWSLRSGRATFPDLVSTIHPRASLTYYQFPSPAKSFLTDTESLTSPGSKVNSHFSAHKVL